MEYKSPLTTEEAKNLNALAVIRSFINCSWKNENHEQNVHEQVTEALARVSEVVCSEALEKSHRELYEALDMLTLKREYADMCMDEQQMHQQANTALENAEKIIKGER